MDRKRGVRVVTIDIRRYSSGLYVATSDDVPGFYLSDGSQEVLEGLIPCALEHMYAERGEPSIVLPAEDHDDPIKHPFAMIPRHLITEREKVC